MRKKTQISLRVEWIEAVDFLDATLQLPVLKAIIAYLTDGTVTEFDNTEATFTFLAIKEDIDTRAEERRRKAAERRAKKAPVPGYIPEKAPENLDERVAANALVDWVVSCHSFKDFRRFDKPLLAELALQVCDWWREHPDEQLPSRQKLRAEINARFGEVAGELAGSTCVTREKWFAHMAPYMVQSGRKKRQRRSREATALCFEAA